MSLQTCCIVSKQSDVLHVYPGATEPHFIEMSGKTFLALFPHTHIRSVVCSSVWCRINKILFSSHGWKLKSFWLPSIHSSSHLSAYFSNTYLGLGCKSLSKHSQTVFSFATSSSSFRMTMRHSQASKRVSPLQWWMALRRGLNVYWTPRPNPKDEPSHPLRKLILATCIILSVTNHSSWLARAET